MTIPEAAVWLWKPLRYHGSHILAFRGWGVGKDREHLAVRIIFLADIELEKGLQSREKLYKEVLSNKESSFPITHDWSRIIMARKYD